MNPLLKYDLITDPFPLQASADGQPANKATLTIVATNNSGGDVKLQGILVKLPVGTNATQLSNDAADISVIAATNWIKKDPQYPDGYVTYNFNPGEGSGVLHDKDSLNFVFTSIAVNTIPGTVLIEVTEGSGNCVPPNCPVQILSITKFPAGWGQVSFSATNTNINAGEGIQLNWDGPAGATYTIEYYTPQSGIATVPQAGQAPLSNHGVYPNEPLTLQQTTTFSLIVDANINGQSHHATAQVTITVIKAHPTINKFYITPHVVHAVKEVSELTFTWDVSNPGQLELDHVGKVTGTSLTTKVNPAHKEYTLRAYGTDGYVDSAIARLQTFDEFIAGNSFIYEGKMWANVPFTATVKLIDAGPGSGSIYILRAKLPDDNGHNCMFSPFSWTLLNDIITVSISLNVVDMILRITDDGLVCQKEFGGMIPVGALFEPTPLSIML